MRSKKEIMNDCKNGTFYLDKNANWPDDSIERALIIELLADIRDTQVKLNKTLSALLLECYGVEAIDRVMAGEHPKEVKDE